MKIHLFKLFNLGLIIFSTAWGMIWNITGIWQNPAYADIRPERVHIANARKAKSYIRDGLIVGGDRAITDVVVKDIRRATNAVYDRIVMDLSGTSKDQTTAIQRPPYYQIAVTPDERRLIFTLWGKPQLGFNAKKVLESFKRSSVIENVMLLPRLEDHLWTFILELKSDSPVEVFELANPVRVIVDIQHKKG